MTPGTKVRTKARVVAVAMRAIPAGTRGEVVATHSDLPYPVEVSLDGFLCTAFYRSAELETIE